MQELDVAKRLAREAGSLVMEVYNTDFDAEIKPDDSPVTQADVLSDKHIRAGLAAAFPDDAILSEETEDDLSRLEKKRVWIVDPIDGTKEFIQKSGEFCICIGLVKNRKPWVGVVYAPAMDTLWCTDGATAWREADGEVQEATVTPRTENLRVAISPNHLTAEEKTFAEAAGTPLTLGSCLKICWIVDGESDVYFCSTYKLKQWDLAAAHAILAAAGGKITDHEGKPIEYNKKDIRLPGFLATAGAVHEELLELKKSL